MIITEGYKVKYLNIPQVNLLLQVLEGNTKYEVITLLLMDCGMRISEALNLKFENFDWKNKIVRIQSLKKRGKVVFRDLPISARLYRKLAVYVAKFSNPAPEDWLFPSKQNAGHLHRTAAHKFYQRLAIKHPALKGLHPHMLRHTCGAMLINNGTEPERIKAILGHKDINLTLNFYAHLKTETLRGEIDGAFGDKKAFLQVVKEKVFGTRSKPIQVIHLENKRNDLIIGREQEISKLLDLSSKHVNVLLSGPAGIGKSLILDNLNLQKKVLRIDDFSGVKKTLAGILLELFNGDKKHCTELVFADPSDLDKRMTRESIKNLADILMDVTEPNEYTIIIDDVSGITPTGVRVMEKLRHHFHIIAAARTNSIKLDRIKFLSNFEKVELEPLARPAALALIEKLSYDMEIEDFALFRNHIYEQCGGTPQYIHEIVTRYKREGTLVTDEVVRNIRHGGGRKEIDMSFIVLLGLAGLATIRYLAGEFSNPGMKLIGGAAMILLIAARYFFQTSRRRFI